MRPLLVSILFVLAVIVFGAFAVLTGLPRLVAALDLGSALIALTLVLTAAVVAFTRHADPTLPDRFSVSGRLVRLSLVTLGATFVLYVSGVLVAGPGLAHPMRGLAFLAADYPMTRLVGRRSHVSAWPLSLRS